jgi:predicted DNA-binding transcriptional regulator AlpA
MILTHDGPGPDVPYRLEPPPNELWNLARLCNEFAVSESTIYGWIREGRLPRPWPRRGGRSLWAPEAVRPALERYRHRMGRESREA